MKWIYHTSSDNKYRFALGEVKRKPERVLFCFGINPSTACPAKTDNTIRRVKALAKSNGYDSWIMLNIYAERATDPKNMAKEQSLKYKTRNERMIRTLLRRYRDNSDILFAFGDLIGARPYLKENLNTILHITRESWYAGKCLCIRKSVKGNPVHPLYQRADSKFVPYL